jgi:Rod binding domain-containing protein
MEIPGLNNTAGMLLDRAEATAEGGRLRRLAESATGEGESRENLVKAAREFEGVFLNTLMQAMRKTVPDNKLFNSNGPTKFYQQMHDTEIAKALATGHSGMGVADLIIKQFEATVDRPDLDKGTETAGGGPAIQPYHPVVGPPAPAALERYNAMSSVGEMMAGRAKLRHFASQQEPAVVDTLRRFEDDINRAALKSGLEPSLILAVVMEESAGNPQARSPKGAMGLMQLMPGTADELGVGDPDSPRENLQGGATYLARMLERFEGRLDLALAAYNAGPGNVEEAGPGVPAFPETQRYVEAVTSRYRALGGGMDLANEKQ